jgi:hypothetical protein
MTLRPCIVVMAVLLTTACGQARGEDSADAPRPDLMLDFESAGEPGEEAGTVANRGTEAFTADVHATGGGAVQVVEGRDGGRAVQLPAFHDGAEAAPLATIGVTAISPAPPYELSPEDHEFEFGADFRLDAESSGSPGDNGDNLVQVGQFSDPAQYKIQIDHRRPSCRLLGSEGEVFVRADVEVEPERWYTVRCERAGVVRLTLTSYDEAGEASTQTWEGEGDPGSISMEQPSQVMSVGGKLQPDGRLVPSASDQLNGAVDDVFLDIR